MLRIYTGINEQCIESLKPDVALLPTLNCGRPLSSFAKHFTFCNYELGIQAQQLDEQGIAYSYNWVKGKKDGVIYYQSFFNPADGAWETESYMSWLKLQLTTLIEMGGERIIVPAYVPRNMVNPIHPNDFVEALSDICDKNPSVTVMVWYSGGYKRFGRVHDSVLVTQLKNTPLALQARASMC